MLFWWLVAWLIAGAPRLHEWNGWAVALLVCGCITAVGTVTHAKDTAA